MAANQKMYLPIYVYNMCTICHNFGNNGRNYTKFGAKGTFELSYFGLGVTSRDLSVTLSVFQKLWRKWTLAQNPLGLEWCNLAKS